jgi:Uma2 family endonuclease
MAIATTHPLTFEDLLETPDDGNRYEILDGELIVSPAPSRIHQEFLGRLYRLVYEHGEAKGLGKVYFAPVDVRLFPHDIVQPDLIFIRADRLHIYRDNPVEGAPDLVVEVISPTSRVRDIMRKSRLYAAAGVPEYWLPDPAERRFLMRVLRDGQYEDVEPEGGILRSTVLPDLVLNLEELFADLD